MLCTFCKKIKPHCQRPGKDREENHACLVRHHANFDDLINSANQGCELCKLFRPYVEYAQFKKKPSSAELVASLCGSDDGYSDCTEQSQVYLFDEDGDGEYGTVRASKYAGYFESGSQWFWFDELDDGMVNSAVRNRRIQMILEKEKEEDKSSGVAMIEQYPTVHNSEIMQWLFHQDGKPVGPEQLWIQGWLFKGEGWPGPGADFAMMGQGERSTVFSLSVGSVNPWLLCQDASFCVDTQPVESTVALAYQIPGIWQQKYNSARISTRWASTARNMQPAFEFYHRRGIYS